MADNGSQRRKPGFKTAVEDVKAIATVLATKAEDILGRRTARFLGILALFVVVVGSIASVVDKTLWDWLRLLIVPVVLGLGAYLFNRSENSRTLKQADHRREEDVLQAYLDQMWKLLLDKDLLRSTSKANSNSEALTAARVSTLITLERIHHHPDKKGIIVKFLSACSLLKKQDTAVILEGANLGGADLHEVDLGGADLKGANLTGVDLSDANLIGADLRGAILRGAYKVTGVETKQPITNEELVQQTKFLEGATMPNGQKFEDWLEVKEGRTEDGYDSGDDSGPS